MRLEVDLAGETRSWGLRGSRAVYDWLASQPWERPRPPLRVHAPADALDALRRALQRALWQELGPDAPRLHHIRCEPPRCLREGLETWLGTRASNARELAESLRRYQHTSASVFLVSHPTAQGATKALKDAEDLVEISAKLDAPRHLAVIFLTDGPEREPFAAPLDQGWPDTADPLEAGRAGWGDYVHERVAWHAGGRFDEAWALMNRISHLRHGQDADLETALDMHADARFARLPPAVQDAARKAPRRLCSDLSTPVSDKVEVPLPWVARALLRTQPAHPARRTLQAALVCRPLADRLLGRCTHLEARWRDRLFAAPGLPNPKPETQRHMTDYQAGRATEHRLSVRPLELASPWDCSTFGEALTLVTPDAPKNTLHELRKVRNALAHGSYVGWNAVTLVDRLEKALA